MDIYKNGRQMTFRFSKTESYLYHRKKKIMVTIQVNSDKNINVSENFIAEIRESLSDSLSRFEEFITRLEVFLADENSDRQGGNDKRCTIEVRIKGRDPEAVTATAEHIEVAFNQATDKVIQLLRNRTDKLKSHS